jgi:gentisate 1,2-dioxygenase
MNAPATIDPRRAEYYRRLSERALGPLWEVLKDLTPREPRSPAVPFVWRYNDCRDILIEGGALLTAEEAERRVLYLENPGMPASASISRTLYAGLQLILPGEVAPTHRHAQCALRLVIEGEGAYTAVDGEPIEMAEGDLILTPANGWHDHGHNGSEPVVWMDILDVPQVLLYDASYVEHGPWKQHPPTRTAGENVLRYAQGLRALDAAPQSPGPQRLMHYPYRQWSATVRSLAERQLDPHFGVALEFFDPASGEPILPTIAGFAQFVPANFQTKPVRRTDSTVFHVCEGCGTIRIGDQEFELGPKDIVVAPSWHAFSLAASQDLVLFAVSDRAAQRKLGLWREERLD